MVVLYYVVMRHLGIDYGAKRIGIAVSDQGGKIAFPKKVIFNRGNKRVMEEIGALLKEESISKIIIGLPISLDGSESEQTKEVRKFSGDLSKRTALNIEFENEMLTTRMAKQAGVSKEHLDESSAALILQSYLDKQ